MQRIRAGRMGERKGTRRQGTEEKGDWGKGEREEAGEQGDVWAERSRAGRGMVSVLYRHKLVD